jgi:hypothetical protein
MNKLKELRKMSLKRKIEKALRNEDNKLWQTILEAYHEMYTEDNWYTLVYAAVEELLDAVFAREPGIDRVILAKGIEAVSRTILKGDKVE